MRIRSEQITPAPEPNDRWIAVDDDSYEPGLPLGHGPTQAEAIIDLFEKTQDRQRDELARVMNRRGLAILHGDTIDELLCSLEAQLKEMRHI